MFPSKAKGPRAAAQGIVAESPEPSRSAARTCSGKPDPTIGGMRPCQFTIYELRITNYDWGGLGVRGR